MKNTQKIIPEASTPNEWKGKKIKEIRNIVQEYISKNLVGKYIVNEDTKFKIKITKTSSRKTAYGEAMYYSKAVSVLLIPQIIKYSKLNNFGSKKATDGKDTLGYANFKCKCRIDGEIKHIRLAVKILKGGNFYYNLEVNKIID